MRKNISTMTGNHSSINEKSKYSIFAFDFEQSSILLLLNNKEEKKFTI